MENRENQQDNLPVAFWASYWNLTAEQLKSIISKIESRDFIKIQNYIQIKLSRGGGQTTFTGIDSNTKS
ncbi:MAG: hypothetical protein ABIP27_17920 [Flavobacterium circumlabens]|uniref:hypothetical protein n=1 Tax=Flavobacterium circumlabens TaxID=2133765 RepID=UPI00326790A5